MNRKRDFSLVLRWETQSWAVRLGVRWRRSNNNDRRCRFCRIFIRRSFHSDITRKTIVPRRFLTVIVLIRRRAPDVRYTRLGVGPASTAVISPSSLRPCRRRHRRRRTRGPTAGGRDSFIKTTFVVRRNYRQECRLPAITNTSA